MVTKIIEIKNAPNNKRFDPPTKTSDPNAASYEHHKAKDYSRKLSERCVFGKDKPIKFTDSAAKLSISPGPSKHVHSIKALDHLHSRSPGSGRKRV